MPPRPKKERKIKKEKEDKNNKPYNNYVEACKIFSKDTLYYFNKIF